MWDMVQTVAFFLDPGMPSQPQTPNRASTHFGALITQNAARGGRPASFGKQYAGSVCDKLRNGTLSLGHGGRIAKKPALDLQNA